MDSKIPVIHIGMPKCGTKTLQWRLFSEHSDIYYLGRYDGPQFQCKYDRFQQCKSYAVRDLMQEISYDPECLITPDFAKCSLLINNILAPAREAGLVPVWSWESYSTDSLYMRTMRARNLKRVFKEAKILMTIRHPVSLLESAYLQQIKRDNIGDGYRFGRAACIYPINHWLNSEWHREIKYHLNYAETIRIYINLFGIKNVHILLFEELCRDSNAYYTRICDIMGIGVGQGLKLVAGHRDNTRWTTCQLNTLADIQRNPLKALGYRLLPRQIRRSLLGIRRNNVPYIKGDRAPVQISEYWRKKILSRTRSDHEWLVKILGLPLEEHGYLD